MRVDTPMVVLLRVARRYFGRIECMGFEDRSSFLLREQGEHSCAKVSPAMRGWISDVVLSWLHALCAALSGGLTLRGSRGRSSTSTCRCINFRHSTDFCERHTLQVRPIWGGGFVRA